MPCGCDQPCNCFYLDTNTVSVTGDGSSGSPYQSTVINDPTGGLTNTLLGVRILLDPTGTAVISGAVTLGAAGLKIDCCPVAVVDSNSIDFSLPGGAVSGDVIIDVDGGLVTTPGQGVGIKIDPAGTAPVSTTVNGLKVDCCAGFALVDEDLIVFTGSGTFTKATYPGLHAIRIRTVGGGGGSGGCAATAANELSSGSGGGGGGYAEEIILASALAANETVTVGAGGAAGAAGNNAGGTGGTSSFGAINSATGGTGGSGGPNSSVNVFGTGGSGGTGIGGDINLTGGDGGDGLALAAVGGSSPRLPYNRGGGSGGGLGASRKGSITTANAGISYGGGAGGNSNAPSLAARAGAAGAPGIVIVELI